MGTALSQQLALGQKLQLAQTQVMSLPVNYLDLVIQKVRENPEIVTETFENMKRQREEAGDKTYSNHNYYGVVAAKISGIKKDKDSNPPHNDKPVVLGGLEKEVNKKERHLPDVEFIASSEYDNKMNFLNHFVPKMELSIEQIPTEVQPFLSWLIKERNWMLNTIGQVYNSIRKVQAPFIYTLNPSRLNINPIDNLPELTGLDYHQTTFGRLLKDRNVRIVSPEIGRADCLPVSYLLVPPIQFLGYKKIPEINAILEKEFDNRNSLSAQEMVKDIEGIARRTIQKYIFEAGIPSCFERQRIYNAGASKPFRIATAIEPFLDLNRK